MAKKTTTMRTLHLMDIENLAGCPRPSGPEVRTCLDHYGDLVDTSAPHQMIVACNHGVAHVVGCCLGRGPRLLVRSGIDGADKALLDVLLYENVEARFGGLVVASGDGIFASVVAQITSVGIPVTVVARRESIAPRLRLAATEVIYFEPKYSPSWTMAVAA